MAAILSAILYPLYPPLGFFGKNPPFYLPLYPPLSLKPVVMSDLTVFSSKYQKYLAANNHSMEQDNSESLPYFS